MSGPLKCFQDISLSLWLTALPILHKYNMEKLLDDCVKSIGRMKLQDQDPDLVIRTMKVLDDLSLDEKVIAAFKIQLAAFIESQVMTLFLKTCSSSNLYDISGMMRAVMAEAAEKMQRRHPPCEFTANGTHSYRRNPRHDHMTCAHCHYCPVCQL